MNWQKLYNPMVIWLLRSPLHRFLDKNTMLITVSGRKSGKLYTLPVSYIRDGETLLVISQKDRTWWKNLQGGAKVTVFVQGHTLQEGHRVRAGAHVASQRRNFYRYRNGRENPAPDPATRSGVSATLASPTGSKWPT